MDEIRDIIAALEAEERRSLDRPGVGP
jgi:hypothetical protein